MAVKTCACKLTHKYIIQFNQIQIPLHRELKKTNILPHFTTLPYITPLHYTILHTQSTREIKLLSLNTFITITTNTTDSESAIYQYHVCYCYYYQILSPPLLFVQE